MAFTVQGVCEPHTESILSQLVDAISRQEDAGAATIKSEILEGISFSLARSAVAAVAKRSSKLGRGAGPRQELVDAATPDIDDCIF